MLICNLVFVLAITQNSMAQSESKNIPLEWQTHAERTDYRETPRYDETVAFSRLLATSSSLIRYTTFGTSNQNRELPLLIAAKDKTFTPQSARRAGKAVVMIQGCIHAGESDGKDAGLALLRDIVINKLDERLLERVVLLFIPIYNVDGHERFSPYNRMNQNGPEAMGWRANATNLNLNRDYMKADAPETRAWLKLWNEWTPDLFVDCHTTDGADFQYNVTYQFEHHAGVAAPVRDWTNRAFNERIFPATEREGNLLSPYIQLRDNREPTRGMDMFIATPRFATGYVPLRNRPALLIETHSLKSYRSRVRGTYDLLRATLDEVNRDTQSLLQAVKRADEATIKDNASYDASRKFPLRFELSDKATNINFKGTESRTELSEISGASRVIYTGKPQTFTLPFYDEATLSVSVTPPLYYVVPAEWRDVIEVLRAHGIELNRLNRETTIEVENYRLRDFKWSASSFENRVLVTFKSELVRERRTLPANSIIISLAQPAAAVAMNLLEPDAPDSLAAWGFFNSAFEQKEYGEDYVLEKLAREMLARDAKLRAEFEERIRTDRAFTASANARLRFFHERSPFWDKNLNLYPVARITTGLNSPLNLSRLK